MTLEQFLLVVFAVIIVFLMILIYLMDVRLRQLLRDFEQMESRISMTDSEVENLMRNVEEIKQLKF
jgi:cell division protein FtsL